MLQRCDTLHSYVLTCVHTYSAWYILADGEERPVLLGMHRHVLLSFCASLLVYCLIKLRGKGVGLSKQIRNTNYHVFCLFLSTLSTSDETLRLNSRHDS